MTRKGPASGSTLATITLPAFLICVCLPLAAAAATPRVSISDQKELLFDLSLPDPTWRELPAAAGERPSWEAILPGFSNHGTPGRPRVPRAGGWLIVPLGTRPSLEVVSESWRQQDIERPLAIEPIPVMVDDPALDGYRESPMVPQPGQELPEDRIPAAALADMRRPDPALAVGPAVRIGEPVWWRGRRIAAYTILPLRVESEAATDQARASAVLSRGQWRVRFVPDPEAGKQAPPGARRRPSGKNDDVFSGHFLNGNLLPQLPTEGALRDRPKDEIQRPRPKGSLLGHGEVRIPVRRTELLRVRASELTAAGLWPQEPVSKDQLRLYQRRYLLELDDPMNPEQPPYLEIEVPIHVVGEGEDFGPGAMFLFWGLRLRDDRAFSYECDGVVYAVPAVSDTLEINNENNIYWLQIADPDPGENWARMEVMGLPVATGEPQTAYRRTDYYNEALSYRENIPAIHVDRYTYNRDSDRDVSVALYLWSPVVGQEGAVLQAGIANMSTVFRTYALDLMRGEEVLAALPDFTSRSRYVLSYQADLPPGVMTGESFSLRMRRRDPPPRIFGYLDWVKVHYDALYAAPEATFRRLLFPGGDGTALGNLRITGFVTGDIGLIEVTDPRYPVFVGLGQQNVVAEGGGFVLSLQVDQSAGPRCFYAAEQMTGSGVPDIRYGDARPVSDPVVPTRLAEAGADVLVVVHHEFRTAAEAWVEHRRGRAGPVGLTFQMVQPQDLYDWYTGGLKDPWAIKHLVDHAVAHPAWGSWALILIGSANENPREAGVLSGGRQWSRDWVPTHFHVQDTGASLPPKVLASDKWFASPSAADADYPAGAGQPTELYVGRLPVHTPAELQRMLTKIQQVENKQPGQVWRRRGVVMADDAYGTGTPGGSGTSWHNTGETTFKVSQSYLAAVWQDSARVSLQTEFMLLSSYMEGLYPQADASGGLPIGQVRQWCRDSGATEMLIAALSRGGTLAHFQGHSNRWAMAEELWFEDDRRTPFGRRDVDLLSNHGKPWLFCGMSCHLGDFAQNVAGPGYSIEPGLGEKLLLWTDAGAVAVYASGGYETLAANRLLSEVFIRRMVLRPPFATVQGNTVTSRWMLGELMWSAEADLLAQANTAINRMMVHQYLLLGDPLMRLDAGLPEIEATLLGEGGGLLPELRADLVALDAAALRTVELRARDEAGIDRLVVLDSAGSDLTSSSVVQQTPFYPDGNRQIMDYVLVLPVRPFSHEILVRVYDSAAPSDSDPHALLTLRVAQMAAAVLAGTGEPIDPASFSFVTGQPVDLVVTVTSAAWLDETTSVIVTGENLQISGVSIPPPVDNHTLRVFCTAMVPEQAAKTRIDRGLSLTIDGHSNYVPLELGATPGGETLVSGLVSFPNPMRDGTHFVFATGLLSGQGKVRVWTVSGREVALVPFTLSGGGQERVSWDGRDRRGDRLANGTYLYRVELVGSAGQGRSGMQRLVIMR